MSTPIGEDGFLTELEIEVREEVTLTESSLPEEAAGLPVAEWPDLDPAIVNPRGGAIAIGHPLGASGARLAGSVAHQLAAAGSGVGVAALCIGVGQGLALVLER